MPVQLSWSGGAGPFTLAVHTYSGSPGPVVDTFTNLQGTSYTYHPKASEANQQLEFQLTDSTGATAQSGASPAVQANDQWYVIALRLVVTSSDETESVPRAHADSSFALAPAAVAPKVLRLCSCFKAKHSYRPAAAATTSPG